VSAPPSPPAQTDRARPGSTTAIGTAIVAVAASLWATDVFFRRHLATSISATEIVFWEHVVLTLAVLPILLRAGSALRRLRPVDWLAVIVVGGGASVTATILFTKALTSAITAGGDLTTPLLLQKLQPVFAVIFAYFVLGERVRPRYFWFLAAALLGSYLLVLDDPGSVLPSNATAPLLAIAAAVLWALGTVLGKFLGDKLNPNELTAVRFATGLPIAAALLLTRGGDGPFLAAGWDDAPWLIALALVPGLIALLLYYRGLERTTASTATLAELSFPATALILNAIAFGVHLGAVQVLGLLILVATVTAMPFVMSRDPTALARRGRRRSAPHRTADASSGA
jgi:drug/metabolite transporter (DMT)-like permease